MFLVGICAAIGLICGLCGWERYFLIGFACLTLTIGALLTWDYLSNIQPFFEKGQGDDGRGIGFGFLLAYISAAGVGAMVAFCFGWVINIILRWMDWL